MIKSSLAGWCVLLVVAPAIPVAAEDAVIEFVDCSGLQLTLDGADHYYWLAPEKGRVLLVRQCVAAEADCDHDVVTVWDREGRKIFEAAPYLDIPEMSGGVILDAALRTPDRLVVSAWAGSSGVHPILAEYDIGTRELLRVVPTGPVQCFDLYGDDEGVTWCLGVDIVGRAADDDYGLVYRFDEVGALQGSTLPRSAFPPEVRLLADTWRGNYRGGFLRGDGPQRLWLPAVNELISFDAEGEVAERLLLPTIDRQQRAHLASSPDGAVYAMIIAGEEGKPDEWTQSLYRLAEDDSAWLPLEGIAKPFTMKIALVGADAEGLVLLDRNTLGLCHLPLF